MFLKNQLKEINCNFLKGIFNILVISYLKLVLNCNIECDDQTSWYKYIMLMLLVTLLTVQNNNAGTKTY